MTKGVMTGCNQTNEKHLESWFDHYSKHNSFPITFCDFGMSEKAAAFCKANGTLLKAEEKLLALVQSPYDKTIWTDINCQINATIEPLFEMAHVKDGFAIYYSKQNIPQTGVIAFTKNSPVISRWQDWSIKNNQTPDISLDNLLKKNTFQLTRFSDKYYWDSAQKTPTHITINIVH